MGRTVDCSAAIATEIENQVSGRVAIFQDNLELTQNKKRSVKERFLFYRQCIILTFEGGTNHSVFFEERKEECSLCYIFPADD